MGPPARKAGKNQGVKRIKAGTMYYNSDLKAKGHILYSKNINMLDLISEFTVLRISVSTPTEY